MESLTSEVEVTKRQLRRDLGGLVFLESVQQIVAIAALLAIAFRAMLRSEDETGKLTIATLTLLAVAYLAFALRVRFAAELVRRDLWLLDAQGRERGEPQGGHPYRSGLDAHH